MKMALFLQDISMVSHKVILKFQEANSVVADAALVRIQSLEKRYMVFCSINHH